MTKPSKKRPASKTSSPSSHKILSQILTRIRKGKSFLVAPHQSPDGDALGSALGLALGLKALGKKVKVYNPDPVPYSLRFLPGSERVTSVLAEGERYDASFLVDCADLDRVGPAFEKHPGLGTKVVLDHHARSRREGDLNFVVPTAASSGMVVLKVLKALKVKIDRGIATNIYVTLATDTGNFRYSNVNAGVFEAAKQMVAAGVVPWHVSRELYERQPKERLKLLPEVLKTLAFSFEERVAVIFVTREMYRQTGGARDMSEDFIEFPRSIDSVEVAIFLKETEDGRVKASLRSKEYVDVGAVAALFGGGGHIRAAGCTFDEGLETARDKLLGALRAVLK